MLFRSHVGLGGTDLDIEGDSNCVGLGDGVGGYGPGLTGNRDPGNYILGQVVQVDIKHDLVVSGQIFGGPVVETRTDGPCGTGDPVHGEGDLTLFDVDSRQDLGSLVVSVV